MIADRLFILGLFGYLVSYMLPFANGYLGIDIEVEIWSNIASNSTRHHNEIAILWSFRWLTNFIILSLWWLKIPEIRRWVIHLTNKSLLDKVLLLIIIIFVCYPFLFENFNWKIGGFLWAFSSILIALSYQFFHIPPPPMESEVHLEHHLVDFEENEI